jgi:hypothetical protein
MFYLTNTGSRFRDAYWQSIGAEAKDYNEENPTLTSGKSILV